MGKIQQVGRIRMAIDNAINAELAQRGITDHQLTNLDRAFLHRVTEDASEAIWSQIGHITKQSGSP